MTISSPVRASGRALFGASALGASLGLALGGAYLAGGLARAVPTSAPAASASTFAVAPVAQDPGRPTLRGIGRRIAAAPFSLRGALAPPRDLQCLSQAVYYEARGESPTGQAAVAQVVLNRVRHPNFPKSVCGVVFQHTGDSCQFSFACDGSVGRRVEIDAWRRAETVAARALKGFVMPQVGASTDFRVAHIPATGLERVIQIGSHVFYRFGGRMGEARVLTATPQPSGAAAGRPVFAALATPTIGEVAAAGAKAVEKAAAAVTGAMHPVAEPSAGKAAPAGSAPAPAPAAAPTPLAVVRAEAARPATADGAATPAA